eukprot:TRINITY_DN1878_c0_g1_i2.p2 TRINITY_DN1878_c0_g1~~TRINITY_DN1878_c0_g1_i2.p2  ORF type:complete len:275 (-),score=21.69 TRINITY_DN1878_c0_g1_i2:181-1005(-)
MLIKRLFSQGFPVGVSTRGWASLKKRGQQSVIQNDFDLITLDFVTEPSTNGAFVIPMVQKYQGQIQDQSRLLHLAKLGVGALPFNDLSQCYDQIQQAILERMKSIKESAIRENGVGVVAKEEEEVSVEANVEEISEGREQGSQPSPLGQKSKSQELNICESISTHLQLGQLHSLHHPQTFPPQQYSKQFQIQKSQLRSNGTHDQPSVFASFTTSDYCEHKVYYSCYQIDRDYSCFADRGTRDYLEHLRCFETKVVIQVKKTFGNQVNSSCCRWL